MAKKSSRSRRDERPRVNQAQLQAYRARQASTRIRPQPVVTSTTAEASPAAGDVSFWGHIAEEYEMIRADLKRLLLTSALMFVIIAVLWFILG